MSACFKSLGNDNVDPGPGSTLGIFNGSHLEHGFAPSFACAPHVSIGNAPEKREHRDFLFKADIDVLFTGKLEDEVHAKGLAGALADGRDLLAKFVWRKHLRLQNA